jgi:hypothetical protein
LQQLQQSVTPALGEQQCRPNYGNVQKQAEDNVPSLGWLFNSITFLVFCEIFAAASAWSKPVSVSPESP